MRYGSIIIVAVLLLSGCWDERLYKNLSVVSLVGIAGETGDIIGYYVYPEGGEKGGTVIVEAEGLSSRDVRLHAQQKVEQSLDLSMLTTVLISDETVKGGIHDFLDVYYRDPLAPITAKIVVVRGEVRAFLEETKSWETQAGEYYNLFLVSLENNSVVIPYTIQKANRDLNEVGKDLVLPYLEIGDEEKKPLAMGMALFSGDKFTGMSTNLEESVYLNLLNDSLGEYTRFSFMYKDKPLTIRVLKNKRKLTVEKDRVIINIDIDITIDEYLAGNLKSKNKVKELESFLEEEMEKKSQRVLKKLQEARSDVLGIGKYNRSYHPEYFEEPWHEKYETLSFETNIHVDITQTGIIH